MDACLSWSTARSGWNTASQCKSAESLSFIKSGSMYVEFCPPAEKSLWSAFVGGVGTWEGDREEGRTIMDLFYPVIPFSLFYSTFSKFHLAVLYFLLIWSIASVSAELTVNGEMRAKRRGRELGRLVNTSPQGRAPPERRTYLESWGQMSPLARLHQHILGSNQLFSGACYFVMHHRIFWELLLLSWDSCVNLKLTIQWMIQQYTYVGTNQ